MRTDRLPVLRRRTQRAAQKIDLVSLRGDDDVELLDEIFELYDPLLECT